jgi:hypothetical protein
MSSRKFTLFPDNNSGNSDPDYTSTLSGSRGTISLFSETNSDTDISSYQISNNYQTTPSEDTTLYNMDNSYQTTSINGGGMSDLMENLGDDGLYSTLSSRYTTGSSYDTDTSYNDETYTSIEPSLNEDYDTYKSSEEVTRLSNPMADHCYDEGYQAADVSRYRDGTLHDEVGGAMTCLLFGYNESYGRGATDAYNETNPYAEKYPARRPTRK